MKKNLNIPAGLAQQNGFGPAFSSPGYYEAGKQAHPDPNKSISSYGALYLAQQMKIR
jgi:hypothetical protein